MRRLTVLLARLLHSAGATLPWRFVWKRMEIEELQKQEEAEAGEEEDGLLGSRGMYGNGESRRGQRWDVKGFVIIALVVSNICLASTLVFSRRSDSASTGGGDTSNNVGQ